MSVVLGIDAAWAERNASGVALVAGEPGAWRCVKSASGFEEFLGAPGGDLADTLARLLGKTEELAGAPVDVVVADIPLALTPAAGCREADKAVSRAFGRRGCPVYPPGKVLEAGGAGQTFTLALGRCGFALAVAWPPRPGRALLEVYPHTALLSLLHSLCRVRYKVGRSLKYWPGASVSQRVGLLLDAFGRILAALGGALAHVDLRLPARDEVRTLASLKPVEDRLDALICAWMGTLFLEGRAAPLGDGAGAIWCPAAVVDEPGGTPC